MRFLVHLGIVSGPNAVTAENRHATRNKYKKCNGVNHMRAIYKSTDRQECQNTEKQLCKYLKVGIHITN